MSYSKIENKFSSNEVVILDGGMGAELEKLGASIDKDLWSGRCSIDSPEIVHEVHQNFVNSGADVITTNTYASTPISMKEYGYGDYVDDWNNAIFFQKNTDNIDTSGEFPYPPESNDVHYELELIVALKSGGSNITEENAYDHIYGFGIGFDMTRRDLQGVCKKMGRPWEIGKAFERSAPMGKITPISEVYDKLEDLNGEPILLHSRGGGTDSIANVIEDKLGIKFGDRSYISGSSNRVAALLANQAKATIIDLSNKKIFVFVILSIFSLIYLLCSWMFKNVYPVLSLVIFPAVPISI